MINLVKKGLISLRNLFEHLVVDAIDAFRILDGFFREFFHGMMEIVVNLLTRIFSFLSDPIVKMFLVYAILWLVVVCL